MGWFWRSEKCKCEGKCDYILDTHVGNPAFESGGLQCGFFSSFPQPLFQAQSKFCDLYPGLRQKVLQPLMDLKFAIPSLQYNTHNNDGSVTCVNSSRHSTPSRCFTPLPVCTTALRSLVFGLTPFGWLLCVTQTPCFWWEYDFWFTPTLSATHLGR